MDQPKYRFFDHTGDFGLELQAESRAQAIAGFARAFLDLLTDAPDTVREREELELEVEGIDAADALVALGNELLFRFEVDGFLCARFEPEDVGETWIAGTAWGERYDAERHPIARPIKAVTHHGAEFEEDETGARVRLVFDL